MATYYAGEYSYHLVIKPHAKLCVICKMLLSFYESIGVPERVNKFYVEVFANIEDISSDDDE